MALGLVVDPIRRDLGLNDTEVSLLAGFAFVLFFVLFSFGFGRWVDTRGRRNVIALGIALWSFAMMACGLAANFWQLFAARMAVGVGEASLNPAAYSIIPDCFAPRRRNVAMAIYASGASIGGGSAIYLGSLLLEWAARTHPVLPFLGQIAPWKILFLGAGLPGLFVALIILAFVREPKRHQSSASASLKEVLAYFGEHRRLFVLTFIGFAGFAINNYGFTVWGPAYFMRVHGFTPQDAGLLFGLGFGVGGTAGMLLGGWWADRQIARGRAEAPIWVALRIAWLQMPFFIVAYLCPYTMPAAVIFCLAMFAASMVGGLQGSMVQALTPNRMRGQAGAIFLMTVNFLGLGIAPTLTGLMTDYVFGGPMGIGKSLAVTTVLSLGMTSVLLIAAMPAARVRCQAILSS
jgi:MFS family permease